MTVFDDIRERFEVLRPFLNERTRRLVAAAEALRLPRGGVTLVAKATGVSRRAIGVGLAELHDPEGLEIDRVRLPGGGRKKKADQDPTLKRDLEKLIEPNSVGDPMSALRWSAKSIRSLASALSKQGHNVSYRIVSDLLRELEYRLHTNRKNIEGTKHPDRNAQFEHINSKVMSFMEERQPVISVDAKKKEKVGDFKNGGRELGPKGHSENVRVHDFILPGKGKVTPYGVYDIASNDAWVSVGVDHDTAAFAVAAIRQWWQSMGSKAYPSATRLLITADGGGSNGSRLKLWKVELQKFADESGLTVSVCHFPPGTSKWNKIEHRLFSFITKNWRGKPLVSHEVIVNLIAATTTKKGLKVKAQLDTARYPKGIKVPKHQMDKLNLVPDSFHGDWNYEIRPRQDQQE
jgi:hypothetical protein